MALDRTAGTADDKLAELHNQITEGVAALTDSDAWRAMLDTAAKFHHYSLGNLLLITAQAPHATRVAGFHTWRSVGRQVRKGERGIAILAPCTFRPKVTDTATPDAVGGSTDDRSDRNDSAVTTDGNKDAKKTRRGQARRFRRAYVFDISQTDGDPLTDVRPELLTGQAPAGLWDSLTAQVQAHGYTVERGPCGTANGYTNPATTSCGSARTATTHRRSRPSPTNSATSSAATSRTCRPTCSAGAGAKSKPNRSPTS